MMKSVRDWFRARWPAPPDMTPEEKAEAALRAYPRCC